MSKMSLKNNECRVFGVWKASSPAEVQKGTLNDVNAVSGAATVLNTQGAGRNINLCSFWGSSGCES